MLAKYLFQIISKEGEGRVYENMNIFITFVKYFQAGKD